MLVPVPAVYAKFNVVRDNGSYKLIKFPSDDGEDILQTLPRAIVTIEDRLKAVDVKRILEVWVGGSPDTDGEIVYLGNVYVFCQSSRRLPKYDSLPDDVKAAYNWLRNKYIELFLQEKLPGVFVSRV